MILIEEFHIAMRVPKGLPDAEYQAIRRTLHDPKFRKEMRRAVSAVTRRHPALGRVRLALSR
jgi:hypothetical protein